MAMCLRPAVLLLLTVAEAAMMRDSYEMNLNPPGDPSPMERVNISARSLIFHCRIPANSSRYRVTFYFRDSNTKNISMSCRTVVCGDSNTSTTPQKQEQMKMHQNQTQPNMKCYCTTWEIQNVTSANNGFYSCKTTIEIPALITQKSSEVEVFIVASEGSSVESTTLSKRMETKVPLKNNPSPQSSSLVWLWLLLGLSSLIVVILMVLCVIIRRARLRNREALDPVYANTHRKVKDRSPRPAHAPRPDQLKLADPYENLRTPSPSRRYEDSKRRSRP